MARVKQIKKVPIERRGLVSPEVLSYDEDNLYPQRIWWMIAGSNSAMMAARELSDNILCDGFVNDNVSNHKNDNGRTLGEVLSNIAWDWARFGAAYLVVQYDATGKAVNVYNMAFEQVRIKLNADYKNDSKVRAYKVFNNWERSADLSTDVNTAKEYPAYNPESVLSEIEACGGIENYPGQIIEISKIKYKGYPLSTFHTVQNEMSVEQLNGTYLRRQFDSGFLSNSIIEFQEIEGNDDNDIDSLNEEFENGIASMAGADASCSVLTIRRKIMDETQSVRRTELNTPINKDLYNAYLEPIRKNICMAAYNLPVALVDLSVIGGGLSASGEIIKELRKMYREKLLPVRNLISETLAKIFESEYSVFAIDDKLNQVNANENVNTNN